MADPIFSLAENRRPPTLKQLKEKAAAAAKAKGKAGWKQTEAEIKWKMKAGLLPKDTDMGEEKQKYDAQGIIFNLYYQISVGVPERSVTSVGVR